MNLHSTFCMCSRRLSGALLIATFCTAGSCSRYAGEPEGSTVSPPPIATSPTTEHEHRAGISGGVIATLGRDEYHTEAVFQPGGVLALYTLGKDETRVHEVQKQVLTAYLQPLGSRESLVMILNPDPLPGDTASMTSRFSGHLPETLLGRRCYVTVPGLRIDGERFTVRFQSPPQTSKPAMPAPREDEEARELHLTAGGLYTEADIAANGGTTAAAKYAGFRANHNLHPQPGAPICPITQTRADPMCKWVIGGKTYTFCCPPCIDEFLVRAKREPEEVLDPHAYIHQE